MDPSAVVRAHIAQFPGYDGINNCRLSDELVRSYLGEALANAAGGAALPPDLQTRVDALLLRVGFADPQSFPPHGAIAGRVPPQDGETEECDAAVVELADRVRSADAASLAGVLDEVTQALDRRQSAMRAAVSRLVATPSNAP